jgi:ADP-ribose pyrophosphatase YjhB (NUDIX family)
MHRSDVTSRGHVDPESAAARRAALDQLIAAYPSARCTEVVQEVSQDDFDRQCAKAQRARGGAIGIVVAAGGEIVLVRRTGLYAGWALPGGTVEPGEAFDAAFRREITEEIGVQVSSATLLIAETKRLVSPAGQHAMFLLAVFEARLGGRTLPPPTADAIHEGLEAALFRPDELPVSMILGDRAKLDLYLSGALDVPAAARR